MCALMLMGSSEEAREKVSFITQEALQNEYWCDVCEYAVLVPVRRARKGFIVQAQSAVYKSKEKVRRGLLMGQDPGNVPVMR